MNFRNPVEYHNDEDDNDSEKESKDSNRSGLAGALDFLKIPFLSSK